MVSKQYTILSLLLPIAMVIGTTAAIYAYQHSYKLLTLMSYVSGLLVVCIFTIIALRSSKKK